MNYTHFLHFIQSLYWQFSSVTCCQTIHCQAEIFVSIILVASFLGFQDFRYLEKGIVFTHLVGWNNQRNTNSRPDTTVSTGLYRSQSTRIWIATVTPHPPWSLQQLWFYLNEKKKSRHSSIFLTVPLDIHVFDHDSILVIYFKYHMIQI